MNPRSVDGVVEKSRKSRLCGTKCCELRRDLGEGQKIATATISLERTCAHRNRLAEETRLLTGEPEDLYAMMSDAG